jgi:MATE family multidrug resistance protein
MRLVRLIMVVVIIWASKSIKDQMWVPWSRKCLDPEIVKLFLKTSVPSALGIVLEVLGFEGMTFISSSFGLVAAGAHIVAFQVLVTSFFFFYGIASAMNVIVGNLLGKRQLEAGQYYAKVGAVLAIISCVLIGAVVLLLRHVLPKIFSEEEDVRALAAQILPLVVLVTIPDSVNQILSAILRAVGRTVGCSVANLVGLFFVSFPMVYLLGFHLDYQLVGVWLSICIGSVCVALIQAVFLWRVDWQMATDEASSSFL